MWAIRIIAGKSQRGDEFMQARRFDLFINAVLSSTSFNEAAARAGLTRVRADISNHADDWNLRYAKTSLRSYRELARAASLPNQSTDP